MVDGTADLCFLVIEPARAGSVAFAPPQRAHRGGLCRPGRLATADPRRRRPRGCPRRGPGCSAYDLYLSLDAGAGDRRPGQGGHDGFVAEQLEVVAGIRAPMEDFVAVRDDLRVLEPRFMEIAQAVDTTRDRSPRTVAFLRSVVEELKASGFVADSLRRAGCCDAVMAPAEGGHGDGACNRRRRGERAAPWGGQVVKASTSASTAARLGRVVAPEGSGVVAPEHRRRGPGRLRAGARRRCRGSGGDPAPGGKRDSSVSQSRAVWLTPRPAGCSRPHPEHRLSRLDGPAIPPSAPATTPRRTVDLR